MLRMDKDMERLMMEKKKELLFDLEKAKKRILEELYCLRRSVHTDVCGLLADYNRIQIELRELTEELKKKIEETTESFSQIFADTYNSYTVQINQHIANFEEVKNTIVTEINEALADLTYMENTVAGLVEQLENLAGTYVTQEQLQAALDAIDFTQFEEEVNTLIQNVESKIVQSDWNECDESSNAFVKNRTHYKSGVDSNITYSGKVKDFIKGNVNIWTFPVGNAVRIKVSSPSVILDEIVIELDQTVDAICFDGSEYIASKWRCGGEFDLSYGTFDTVYGSVCACTNEKLTIVKHSNSGYASTSDLDVNIEISIGDNVYTQLDPRYVVDDLYKGTLLGVVDGKITTMSSPFTSYTKCSYTTMYNGLVPYKETSGDYAIFEGEAYTDVADKIANSYHVFKMQHYQFTSRTLTINTNSNFAFSYSVSTRVFTLKIPLNKIVDADYENNGAFFEWLYPSNVTIESNCILYSPNNTPYRIVVADDGTLSTEAVTE